MNQLIGLIVILVAAAFAINMFRCKEPYQTGVGAMYAEVPSYEPAWLYNLYGYNSPYRVFYGFYPPNW